VKPARFMLSLLGIALFLAIGTILIFSAVAESSGRPMLDWGANASTELGIVLLVVLVIRAALLWVDNRKETR